MIKQWSVEKRRNNESLYFYHLVNTCTFRFNHTYYMLSKVGHYFCQLKFPNRCETQRRFKFLQWRNCYLKLAAISVSRKKIIPLIKQWGLLSVKETEVRKCTFYWRLKVISLMLSERLFSTASKLPGFGAKLNVALVDRRVVKR